MLEQMRKSSQSLLIYVLFGIVIAVFIINFGPQARGGCDGSAERADSTFAAKVEGRTVGENSFRYGFSLLGGAQHSMQEAKAGRIKERILDKLIERELLADEATRMGFQVSEDQVAEMVADQRMIGLGYPQALPYSQKDGKFDYESFKRFAMQLGLAPKAFLQEQQREMLAFRVKELMRDAVKVSADEVKSEWERHENRVNVEYVRVSPQHYEDELELGADEIGKFAGENEAKLKARYEERKFMYEKAPLELKLRHILVELEPKASDDQEAAAEKKADALVKRVKGGEAFAKVAREASDDVQSKARGGDLGWRRKTATGLGVAVDEKLYGAKPGEQAKNGEVVGPLRGSRGWEIVTVEASREGDLPFDKVKLDLAEEMLRSDRAKARARADAEAVLARARAQKDKTLKELYPGDSDDKKDTKKDDKTAKAAKPAKGKDSREAAFAAGLKAEETGMFARRGAVVEGIGISAELGKAVFELKSEQPFGGPYEVGGGFVVVKLKERKTADPAEFDKRKAELMRDAALMKWEDVVSEWAQQKCIAAKQQKRLEVNTDLLRYDQGPDTPVSYDPCSTLAARI